jgi:putative zinc finger protein
MNCLSVRDRLPEHALGVLARDEATTVDRHVEWCAACRKEAGELQRAAATLAYSVAPVEPPAGLEDSIVGAVRGAAGRRGAAAPRRSRVAAAAVLAAMLALSGLGWGVVMARRSDRLEQQVREAVEKQKQTVRGIAALIEQVEGADRRNVVELAGLMSPRRRAGAGDALVLLSPSTDDLVFVLVTGLIDVRPPQLPLEVGLVDEDAGELRVGRIATLNSGGGAGVSKWYLQDLRAFDAIVIRDAHGKVLLNGTLSVHEPPS